VAEYVERRKIGVLVALMGFGERCEPYRKRVCCIFILLNDLESGLCHLGSPGAAVAPLNFARYCSYLNLLH